MRLAEAERPQLGGVGLATLVVDLGDGEHHRPAGTAQRAGDDEVGLGGAGLAVDHEQHEVGGGDRALGLRGDHRLQPAGVRLPAAGVDEGEPPSVPECVVGDPVAGHARHVLHDGLAAAQDAVDQRRLADVGPADDRDDRRGRDFIRAAHRTRPVPARTSALSAFMTTSVDELDHPVDDLVDAEVGRVELDRSVGYL